MKTDKIAVNNRGTGMHAALAEVEKYAAYRGLGAKEALRLRLLAEELMGMVKGIVGEFSAYFYIEGEDRDVRLCLETLVAMDHDTREALLAVASSGKNAASVGVMGKLRDVLERYLLLYDDIDRDALSMGATLGLFEGDEMLGYGMDWTLRCWSLSQYTENVRERAPEQPEAWDELEKSVVANLADDVTVSIRSGKVEVVVTKRF